MDTPNTLNYSWEIVKIFLYLGVVILFIYLLNYFLRNYRSYFKQQGTILKIIDRGFLSQNAQIAIVQVKNKYYLLGITEEKVTLLDTLTDLDADEKPKTLIKKGSLNFAEILKGTFGKRDGGNE